MLARRPGVAAVRYTARRTDGPRPLPGSPPAVAALAATAVLATACGRPHEAPPPARVRADIVLPGRDPDHRGRRAPAGHARNDPPRSTNCPRPSSRRRSSRRARCSTRVTCAPTAVPPGAVHRRIPERVRVSDRRRPFPAHRQSRSIDAREARRRGAVSTTRKRASSRSAAGLIGEHSSLIAAVDRDRRARATGDLARRALQRPDRLRERSAARRFVRGAVRDDQVPRRVRRLRLDPGRAVHQRAAKSTRRIAGCNPETQKAGYYDEQGRSLKRFVLASPLRFTPRVTSGFSRRRMHPVHQTVRAHLGVDYAAPTGTPVVAVASGVVVSAGWAGGGGRQVQHSSRQRVRELLPAPLGVCQGASAPARTSIRGSSSDASGRRARRPVRTSTTGCEETACSSIRAASTRASRQANRFRRCISTDFSVARDEMLQQFSTDAVARPRRRPADTAAETRKPLRS